MAYMHPTKRPNTVRTRVLTFGLLVLGAAFDAGTASAFSIGIIIGPIQEVGGPIHQEITREALGQVAVTFYGGQSRKFTDSAIEDVVAANVFTDQQFANRPEFHFDNNALPLASLRIAQLKEEIVAALRTSLPLTLQGASVMRIKLGFALHTLQDFYSHSNWVEHHPDEINTDLGRGVYLQEHKATASEMHCHPDTTEQRDDEDNFFTEELFSEYAWGSDAELQFANAPEYECAHGLVGYGIHKDWAGRDLHPKARSLAVEASLDLMSQILAQATNAQSVCALLQGAYCPASPTISVSFSGTVTDIYGFTPKPAWVYVGAPVSGSFSYDSTVVDAEPSDPTQGSYNEVGSGTPVNLTIGGHSISGLRYRNTYVMYNRYFRISGILDSYLNSVQFGFVGAIGTPQSGGLQFSSGFSPTPVTDGVVQSDALPISLGSLNLQSPHYLLN